MATWRDVYHDEIERQLGFLKRARDIGQTWLEMCGRFVDPTRMSDDAMRWLARREAEQSVNRAINTENEQLRRRGRPADVVADEIFTRPPCTA